MAIGFAVSLGFFVDIVGRVRTLVNETETEENPFTPPGWFVEIVSEKSMNAIPSSEMKRSWTFVSAGMLANIVSECGPS